MPTQALDILVVDDDRPLMEVVEIALSGYGHHVRTATDGHAALESVERAWPDLLLLDLMLPECDGFEVASRVRARQPAGRRLPIILLTGLDARAYQGLALSYGVDDYLVKPFRLDELLSKVETWGRPSNATAG